VATVLVGNWVGEFDRARAERVLSGEDPFDEATMLDDEHADTPAEPAESASEPPARAGTSHA
jgi:aerobic C4-dicarboxylate transport protein